MQRFRGCQRNRDRGWHGSRLQKWMQTKPICNYGVVNPREEYPILLICHFGYFGWNTPNLDLISRWPKSDITWFHDFQLVITRFVVACMYASRCTYVHCTCTWGHHPCKYTWGVSLYTPYGVIWGYSCCVLFVLCCVTCNNNFVICTTRDNVANPYRCVTQDNTWQVTIQIPYT